MLMATSIGQWPIGTLIPYARNTCKRSDAQVAQNRGFDQRSMALADLLTEFGFMLRIRMLSFRCSKIRGEFW
jgi:hypothetical protein